MDIILIMPVITLHGILTMILGIHGIALGDTAITVIHITGIILLIMEVATMAIIIHRIRVMTGIMPMAQEDHRHQAVRLKEPVLKQVPEKMQVYIQVVPHPQQVKARMLEVLHAVLWVLLRQTIRKIIHLLVHQYVQLLQVLNLQLKVRLIQG